MSYIRSCLRQILLLFIITTISIGIFALPARATAVYEVPVVSAGVPTWIVDKADVMSLSTQGNIKGTLEKLAQQTGKEVRFVTIHRLDYGDTIQTFTDKLFKKWFATPAEQANQTLIVLDNVTNTIGIQTGTDVKATLTDAIATSTISETMGIPLRSGNKYNQAFSDATDRLGAVLSGQADPGPPKVISTPEVGRTYLKAEETDANRTNFLIIVIGLLIAATVIPMATWWWYQNQD
ncbi:photosystem II repair protein Psb32 [Chamaesiphon sp. VAR_48_metabat_135_sub]|uniref:photosystem II repair protein Psb32 n=1 Tax=Chamaesiphon sp. VAR_48_metabat_135_sub TaxID=2964699 RepID=UPI00286C56BC|nr:TPM domain-containing protein [Chamaesiphon sp. VAR_48_metabat_135_sub]